MILQMDVANNNGVHNAMWILSVLEFTYIVKIYRRINAPGNGRGKIYGINGSDKTSFKNNFMIGTEEYNN